LPATLDKALEIIDEYKLLYYNLILLLDRPAAIASDTLQFLKVLARHIILLYTETSARAIKLILNHYHAGVVRYLAADNTGRGYSSPWGLSGIVEPTLGFASYGTISDVFSVESSFPVDTLGERVGAGLSF